MLLREQAGSSEVGVGSWRNQAKKEAKEKELMDRSS